MRASIINVAMFACELARLRVGQSMSDCNLNAYQRVSTLFHLPAMNGANSSFFIFPLLVMLPVNNVKSDEFFASFVIEKIVLCHFALGFQLLLANS